MTGRALVLGSGGLTGISWELGALHALRIRGVDITHWDLVVATSTGAFVAACLLTGCDDLAYVRELSRDVTSAERAFNSALDNRLVTALRLGQRRPLSFAPAAWTLGAVTATLGAAVREAGVRGATKAAPAVLAFARGTLLTREQIVELAALSLTARHSDPQAWERYWAARLSNVPDWPRTRLLIPVTDAITGKRRTLHARSGVPIATAVAASAALPVLVPPVVVGENTFWHGAARSTTNADLVTKVLPAASEVLVLAPLEHGTLAGEVAALRAAGVRVTVVKRGKGREVHGAGLSTLDVRKCRENVRQGIRDAMERDLAKS